MKFIFKILLYIVFFFGMILILLPKENIYFMAVNELDKVKVELDQNSIDEKYFGISLYKLGIKYDNIDVARISNLDITTYLLDTKININNIVVDKAFSKFAPRNIDFITISHSIIDPLKIDINVKFKLGRANGYIDIVNRVIKLNIVVSRSFRSKYGQIVRNLKREKNKDKKEEYYSYEYKF